MLFANNPMLTADDRQQAGYAGLMALAQGLMAGGAPSLQPGGMAKGLAEGFGGFAKNYQGSLTNAAAMKSAALQQQMAQTQLEEAKRKQEQRTAQAKAIEEMFAVPSAQFAMAGNDRNGPTPQAAANMQPPVAQMFPGQDMAALKSYAAAFPDQFSALVAKNIAGKDPTATIQEFEFAKKNGYTGSFTEFLAVKHSAGAAEQYGLTPIPGVDEKGNPILAQLSNRGAAARPVQFPPGFSFTPPVKTVDTGTGTALVTPSGQTTNIIPKDNRTPARDKALGGAEGEQAAAAPGAIASADQMLKNIEGVEKHPYLKWSTGLTSPLTRVAGTPMFDLGQRVEQIKGGAFLEAFEKLKGGGQITETEGAKATAAIARINLGLSEKDMRAALKDLREVVEAGRARASVRIAPQTPAPATPDPLGLR
jgi:hypothetical protein